MPLSKEQILELKKHLRGVRSRPGRFLYCQEGESGDPVLVMDKKRIPPRTIQDIRKTARKKVFVRGTVEKADRQGYVFRTRGKPPPRFELDLRRFFARAIPQLKGSYVEQLGSTNIIESLDGEDADDRSGVGLEEISLEELTRLQASADAAEHEAAALAEEEAHLGELLSRLEDQHLHSSHELQDADQALAAELASYNPFFRQSRITQRKLQQARAQEEEQRLAEVIEQTRRKMAQVKAQLEQERLTMDRARESVEDALVRWGEEQESFWTGCRNDPEWLARAQEVGAAHGQAYSEAETARNARDAAAESLSSTQAFLETSAETLQLDIEEVAHLEAEIADLEKLDQLGPNQVRRQATMEARLDQLRRDIARLKESIPRAEKDIPRLESELRLLDAEFSSANFTAMQARRERDQMYMSQGERALAQVLSIEREEARRENANLKALYLSKKAVVDELRTSMDTVRQTGEAFKQAQAALFAAQIHRERTEETAKLWNIPGMSGRRARIKAASDALPDARLAEKKALEAFEEARRARDAALTDDERRVGLIQKATERMQDAEHDLLVSEVRLGQAEHRRAEEHARIVGWAEDIHRQQLETHLAQLAEGNPALRDLMSDVDDASQALAEASSDLTDAVYSLDLYKIENERCRAALTDGLDPESLMELKEGLDGLPQARERLATAESDQRRASAEMASARAALDEKLRVMGNEDPRLRALLDSYAQLKTDLSNSRQADADAAERLSTATRRLNDNSRSRDVHELLVETEDYVLRNAGLITAFHHLVDESDLHSDGFIIDLLEKKDRQRAEQHRDYGRLLRFQEELERRALALLSAGASTRELADVFSHIPTGLRPPSWREEVQAFAELDEVLELTDAQREEARVLRAARQVADPDAIKDNIRARLKQIEGLPEFESFEGADRVAGMVSRIEGALNDPLFTRVPENLQKVEDAMGYLCDGLEIIGAADGAGQVEVAKKRYDEVTQNFTDRLLDLQSSGLDAIKLIQPIIDQLKGPVTDLSRDIILACIRRGQARHTTLLKQAARASGSPLAGAFEEALVQENELWAEHSLLATMDALDITGKLIMLYPDGISGAVGVALQLGAKAIKGQTPFIFSMRDWSTAKKAKALLTAAKKGDAEAKATLMKFHPLYAKGLIAYMAQQDDPYARLYITGRGLDEGQIKKHSARILTYYLLDDAGQLDADGELVLETRAEWWERKKDEWRKALLGGLSRIKKALTSWMSAEPSEFEKMEIVRRAAEDMARAFAAARQVLATLQDRLASLVGAAADELKRRISEVKILIDSYGEIFNKARRGAISGLDVLNRVEREVGLMQRRDEVGGLTEDAQKSFKTFSQQLPRLREGYLVVVDAVNRSA